MFDSFSEAIPISYVVPVSSLPSANPGVLSHGANSPRATDGRSVTSEDTRSDSGKSEEDAELYDATSPVLPENTVPVGHQIIRVRVGDTSNTAVASMYLTYVYTVEPQLSGFLDYLDLPLWSHFFSWILISHIQDCYQNDFPSNYALKLQLEMNVLCFKRQPAQQSRSQGPGTVTRQSIS